MKGFLKKIKLILSARNLKFKQSIIISIWPDVIILVSFIFAVKYIISNEPSSSSSNFITDAVAVVTSSEAIAATSNDWWFSSFAIIGFVISYIINLYKNEKKNLLQQGGLVSLSAYKAEAKVALPSQASHFFSFIINFIWKGIIFILGLSLGISFDLFNTIYCDETDSETETDTEENNKESKNKNKGKDDDQKKDSSNYENSYKYSGSIDKGVVASLEAVEGVVEGVGKVLPELFAAATGAKLGSAIIKSAAAAAFAAAPLLKAGLGILTAAASSAGLSVALNVAKEINKNIISKANSSSSIRCQNSDSERLLSKIKDNDKDINTDFDIPSILEYGDVLSPLQNLLNNEIAILLLILIHIFIIIMVLVNKFYVSRSLNLISKLFSNSKLLVKFERYKIIVDKFSNRFINLLLVINITFILAYILLLLYINIKLSSNLDDFIDVHNDMKKGIILFINSKFLFCLDNTCCGYRNRSCSCNLNYYLTDPSLVGCGLKPSPALAGLTYAAKLDCVNEIYYRFHQHYGCECCCSSIRCCRCYF